MKKFIFLLSTLIVLTACASKSTIITTKSNATSHDVQMVWNTKYQSLGMDTFDIEKPDIHINNVQEDSNQTELKNEQLTETIDDEFILTPKIDSEIDESLSEEYEENVSYNPTLSEKIVAAALENIGIHYHTGGTTKSGFDCSGLLVASFSKFDIKLPRTSIDMSRYGKRINPTKAQKGDLIFFKTLGSRKINHVGLVIEVNDDEIKFVHASIKKGVMISTTKEGYYKNKFAQVNRVLE
jgi:cell wall-associated NlpC family hydrolase